jgi:hypothetical protein
VVIIGAVAALADNLHWFGQASQQKQEFDAPAAAPVEHVA